jgi:Domain of unknown function (DUF4258)
VSPTLEQIRAAALAGRIRWRYHALQRARQRGITRQQAKDVICTGELIEEHPDAEPFPACLLMANVLPSRPLYVSLAYDEFDDYIYVVTVHWLDPNEWEDPWTRRVKKP